MTNIQWTDETWNPVSGCTRVSEGCRNCYIERTPAFRMSGRRFVNGTTGITLHPDRLAQPLKWKKPRRIFVNSLSDLFHEDVPREFIKAVVGVTMDCPQHTFQILTKRPERMRDFCRDCQFPSNVWLGVSAEDQKAVDKRIPLLLQTPAAVRFLSCEPLLGPINISRVGLGRYPDIAQFMQPIRKVDWVIVGGESGPRSRPCDLDWIRSIKDQCQVARVPVFVKQLGAVPMMEENAWRALRLTPVLSHTNKDRVPSGYVPMKYQDKKGGEPSEWPADLRVREWPQ